MGIPVGAGDTVYEVMRSNVAAHPRNPPHYDSSEVCMIAGITQRQLIHWLDRKIVESVYDGDGGRRSGKPLYFDKATVSVIVSIARFVQAGVQLNKAVDMVVDEKAVTTYHPRTSPETSESGMPELLRLLLEKMLPEEGDAFPTRDRMLLFRALAANLDVVYGEEDEWGNDE
jgi:DNA-binding transcriptional MerR regulator